MASTESQFVKRAARFVFVVVVVVVFLNLNQPQQTIPKKKKK